MWHINDDGAVPPLPQVLRRPSWEGDALQGRVELSLRPGCWVVRLDPVPADDFNAMRSPDSPLRGWTLSYRGTLRVDSNESGIRASGDLYLTRQNWARRGMAPPPLPPPGSSIPIYPRQDYSSYFSLRDIRNDPQTELPVVTLALSRFQPSDSTWGPEEILTATVMPLPGNKVPPAWQGGDYLFWGVRNDRGTLVARLQTGWLSDSLRRAKIDFAVANGIEAPLSNAKGVDLSDVFAAVGWEVEVPDLRRVDGPGEVWQERDLHARMLELRRDADLDRTWNYHVLVVPRWQEQEEHGFGKMYDVGAVDSNLVPREGVVIAATARFPDEPRFGAARGQRLGDVPAAAFHCLVHELGHAMGLLHRFHGKGFMQGLIYVADQAVPPAPAFPGNLEFAFDPDDMTRLRHYPDMWIRPGGVPFGQGYSALPVPDADAITDVGHQFELTANPLRRKVPLGAPVKLQLRLTNISRGVLPGPARFGLSHGSVAGRVVGPDGRTTVFSGAVPLDYVWTTDLQPGAALFQGETLLRGAGGALFPAPGRYRIEVEAGWVGPGGIARVGTNCEVVVRRPRNRAHKQVAHALLQAEDLSILLIFRPTSDAERRSGQEEVAEEVAEAVEILHRALGTPELRDIYGPLEARRRAETDLAEAARLIDEASLMTSGEIEHLLDIVGRTDEKARRDPVVQRMIEICRDKSRELIKQNLAPRSLYERLEGILKWC